MSANPIDQRLNLSITPREAHEFLLKLSTDDEFRRRLERNPAEALAEYHISVPLELIPGVVSLPPKEVVQQALSNFTRAGELNVRNLHTAFASSMWPFVLFWWLYFTPARPPHRKEGDKLYVAD
jgi:putative modified peptide